MRTMKPLTLGTALIATALTIAGCTSDASEDPDGAATPGAITVVTANNPWSEGIQKQVAEFEEETGITVNFEQYGNEQLNDTYKVRLNASSSDFDVMIFQVQDVMREFSRNAWLTDMTDYINDSGDWNWEDFQPATRDAVELDGVIYGVPLMTERHILYYRTDIFEENGLEAPTTIEDLEAAADSLHDPANNMVGIAMRGDRVAAVTQFSSFLYSFGGDFQDGATATVDTPEAVAAYETYGRLLREYGPSGASSMGWVEASALFAQGRAAMYLDADSQAYTFLDPDQSAVVDTVGYATFPAGPAGSHPYSIVPWTAGINEFSQNKDAAWEFIRWATSEERFISLMTEDTVPSPRQSSWDSADATAAFPEGIVENVTATAETSVGHDRPQLEQVARSREIVGGPIVASIEGGNVAEAAQTANVDFQNLLDTDG